MNHAHVFTQLLNLAGDIWVVGLFVATLVQAGTPDATIQCASVEAGRNLLRVSCRVANTGGNPVYLLLDDFVLEGPAKSIGEYLYMPLGGLRYENVLQYHQKSVGSLEFGELFDPWTTVNLKKLTRLALLERGATREIIIEWPLVAGEYPYTGKWIARLSLLYLPQEGADELLRQGSLPPICRNSLLKNLKAVRNPRIVELLARRPTGERKFLIDGCHDVISRKFSHLFSNTFEIDLN